jgi:membrane protease YdiL (CAAX protease family)
MDEQVPTPAHPPDLRRGIAGYLLIAFGLAWAGYIPALFGKGGSPILMPFAPAVAAFIVRKWVTREGFADSGWRPHLRQWPLYLLAVAWPIATNFLSIMLAFAAGVQPADSSLPWGVSGPGYLQLLGWAALSVAIAPIIFGEEFGWRGYLQVRLFAENPWKAAISTGLIWGVWHYPLIFAEREQYGGLWVGLLVFPIATTNMSIFLGWLRRRTSDVWSTSTGHGSNNVTEDSWHRTAFTGSRDGTPSVQADIVVVVAEAIILIGIVLIDSLFRRSHPVGQKHQLAAVPVSEPD